MGSWIIIIPILGILYSQELPYGKPKYFDIVAEAMQEVVERGTARRAKIDSITVCG